MRSKKVSSYFQEIGLDKPFIIMRKADEVVGEAPRFSDFCCGFHEIQASRVSRFWLERNASWDMLGQKVSTTSTRTQESNKQNREFTEENYGWVSRKLEKYQKLQGSSA